jgi:endonuclease-3 related protein
VALSRTETIRAFYQTLFRAWGRQHWWPAQSRFEVVVGAFLTQNTAWINVEKATAQLRRARVLSLTGIRNTPLPQLEQLIRSAGYFRQKAARLKNFVAYLDERHAGSLHRMFTRPTDELREQLLALNGIGPETADSILLYAGNHPVFVVDAYTRRILDRHRILPPNAPYDDIRNLFEAALEAPEFVAECESSSLSTHNSQLTTLSGACHPASRISTARRTEEAQVFNEMHGLIVGVGKNFCLKSKALCEQCPLRVFLPVRGPRLTPQARARGPRLR